MCISHSLICVIFLFLSFHQCSILIFQLSAIRAIWAVICLIIWNTFLCPYVPHGPITSHFIKHLTWYWPTVTSTSNTWQRQFFWCGSYMDPSTYFNPFVTSRTYMSHYFCMVHVVTFTVFKTNSCTYFKTHFHIHIY
jgi:hypothetical protein